MLNILVGVIVAAATLGRGAPTAQPAPGPRPAPAPLRSSPSARFANADRSTINTYDIAIYPTISSLNGGRPGMDTPSYSVEGVEEETPFNRTSYVKNNITQKVTIDLAPGKTVNGQGVLGREVTLGDIDYIRTWTKREFLTEFGHDYYLSLYTELESDDNQESWYNTLLQGETGYFPERIPYDRRNLGEWMYADTRTPANYSGTLHGEGETFFPGAPYIDGSGFMIYDWNRCENIGFYDGPTFTQVMDRDFTWDEYPNAGTTTVDPTTPYVDKVLFLLRIQSSLSTDDWKTFIGALSRIEVGIAFAEDDLHLINYDMEAFAPSPSPTPSPLPPGVSHSPTPSPSVTPSSRPPPPDLADGWPQARGDESNAGFFKGGLAKSAAAKLVYDLPETPVPVSRSLQGPVTINYNGTHTYAITVGGILYAMESEADEFSAIWYRNLGKSIGRGMAPALSEDQKTIYVASSSGRVWSANVDDLGAPTWSPAFRDLTLPSDATVDGALRVTTGISSDAMRRRLDEILDAIPSGPEGSHDTYRAVRALRREARDVGASVEVLMLSAGKRLFVMQASDGSLLWACDSNSGTNFKNGMVSSFVSEYSYAATVAGEVYAFDVVQAADKCAVSGGKYASCSACAEWISYTDFDRWEDPTEDAPAAVDAPSVDYVSRRVLVATSLGDWGAGKVYAYDLGEHAPRPYVLYTASPNSLGESQGIVLAPTAALIVPKSDTTGSRAGDPVLYVYDTDGRINAVLVGPKSSAPDTGYTAVWTKEVGRVLDDGQVYTTASGAVSNGTFVVINTEDEIISFRASTGEIKWEASHVESVASLRLPAPAPAIDRLGTVRVATRGAKVLSFAADCEPLTAPVNGQMNCFTANNGLTACKFKCDEGFYQSDPNVPDKAKCQLGGQWSSGVPMCVAVQCTYSQWSAFSTCTVECGQGTKSRSRTVKQAVPPSGESGCIDLSQTVSCNTHDCPEPTAESPPFIASNVQVPVTSDGDDDEEPEWTTEDSTNFRESTAEAMNGARRRLRRLQRRQQLQRRLADELEHGHLLGGVVVKASNILITDVELEVLAGSEEEEKYGITSYAWDVDFRVSLPGATKDEVQAAAVAFTNACSSGKVNGTCAPAASLEIVSDPASTFGTTTARTLSWAEALVIVLLVLLVLMMVVFGLFAMRMNHRLKQAGRRPHNTFERGIEHHHHHDPSDGGDEEYRPPRYVRRRDAEPSHTRSATPTFDFSVPSQGQRRKGQRPRVDPTATDEGGQDELWTPGFHLEGEDIEGGGMLPSALRTPKRGATSGPKFH